MSRCEKTMYHRDLQVILTYGLCQAGPGGDASSSASPSVMPDSWLLVFIVACRDEKTPPRPHVSPLGQNSRTCVFVSKAL